MITQKQESKISHQMSLLNAVVIIVCAQSMTAFVPLLLGSLVDDVGLAVAEASDIVAASTAGLLLGTAFIVMKGHLVNRQTISFVAFILMLLSCTAALFIHQYPFLLITMLVAGTGSGAGLSLGLALLVAGHSNTAQRYGIAVMSLAAFNAVIILGIPSLTEWFGVNGIIAILLSCSLVGCIFSSTVPRIPYQDASKSDTDQENAINKKVSAIALVATLVLFTGFTLFWPFIERIAVEAGVAKTTIATSYSLGMIGVGASGFVASLVGDRFGHLKPLFLACGFLSVGSLAIVYGLNAQNIVFLIPLFQFNYILLVIFNNVSLAVLDASGRVLVAGVFMESTGWFIGPLVAGQILRVSEGYVILAAIFIVTTVVFLFLKSVIALQGDAGEASNNGQVVDQC